MRTMTVGDLIDAKLTTRANGTCATDIKLSYRVSDDSGLSLHTGS